MSTMTHETHPVTGRPIQETPTFKVGDLVTEAFNGDGYPGVVVHATAKTAWVASVRFVGNFSKDDAPGYNGYGDSGTIAIDPEDVAAVVAKGKDAATKYVLYVSPHVRKGSFNDDEKYGGTYHPAKWHRPGGGFTLSAGARYRQNPHV